MSENISGINGLLDKLLALGKNYAAQGKDFAETKLDIPDDKVERDAMVDGMKKGAIASAVLVGLLGTKSGRSLTGSAIKLGSLAALGAAAYKGFQNWQETGHPLTSESSETKGYRSNLALHKLSDTEATERSLLILKALVAAAQADGHVDDQEIQTIRHELIEMHLPDDLAAQVEAIVDSPISVKSLAAQVFNEQTASEVYLATRLIISKRSTPQEHDYLQALVDELGMSSTLCESLDSQIA